MKMGGEKITTKKAQLDKSKLPNSIAALFIIDEQNEEMSN